MFAYKVAVYMHKSACKVLTRQAMLRSVTGMIAGLVTAGANSNTATVLILLHGACEYS